MLLRMLFQSLVNRAQIIEFVRSEQTNSKSQNGSRYITHYANDKWAAEYLVKIPHGYLLGIH
jgi:thioester reductase-like protein